MALAPVEGTRVTVDLGGQVLTSPDMGGRTSAG